MFGVYKVDWASISDADFANECGAFYFKFDAAKTLKFNMDQLEDDNNFISNPEIDPEVNHYNFVFNNILDYSDSNQLNKILNNVNSVNLQSILYLNAQNLCSHNCMTLSSASVLDPLLKVNNKILRILQNQSIRTPLSHLYSNFNILSITALRDLKIACLMHIMCTPSSHFTQGFLQLFYIQQGCSFSLHQDMFFSALSFYI